MSNKPLPPLPPHHRPLSRFPENEHPTQHDQDHDYINDSHPQRASVRNSVRAYAINNPDLGIARDVRQPQRASIVTQHVNLTEEDYEICRGPTLLTVGPDDATFTKSLHPQSSFASSGISVTEVSVPVPLAALDAVHMHTPGTYRCVVTQHVPQSSTTLDSDGASVEEKPRVVSFAVEPLAGGLDIASKETLDAMQRAYPIPPLPTKRRWMQIRYLGFTFYRRLMVVVLVANIITLGVMISHVVRYSSSFTYGQAATAVGANLLVGTLMRHEHFVNLLFFLACSLPSATPLQLRRQAAKIAYNNGGIHAGCGVSALMWYVLYTILLVCQFNGNPVESQAMAATTAATLILFLCIVTTAHPMLRAKFHDQWELTHRYGGWTAIALVWAQTSIIAATTARQTGRSTGTILATSATFWFLLIITFFLIHPWLYLRRRTFTAEPMSSHATRLWFNQNKLQRTCVATRLSHSPLIENHGFATIPNANGEKGYSIVVSNAGDWTKKLITSPPSHIWTRGAFTTGVMRVSSLFKPIVVIATGSGIGPCLSFLQVRPDHPMRVLWSARFPEATYGRKMLDAVFRADPRAVVVDTKKTGHPNLPALAYALCGEIGAEAVIVISNPKVTRDVVFEMEARGIAAFGAVFDS